MMLSLLGVVVSAANQPKPHIILVVADDQGHANIGYHNASTRTPRIDALAASGVKLENYYVQPICSPTRSALMTGRYTNRLGTQATVIRSDVPFGVPLENTFLSQNMQDAGCELQLCTLPRRSQVGGADPTLPCVHPRPRSVDCACFRPYCTIWKMASWLLSEGIHAARSWFRRAL